MVNCKHQITKKNVISVAKKLGIDWEEVLFTPADMQRGMKIELEHGKCIEGEPSPETNVTNDNLLKTGQIALAHLKEDFRYYDVDIGLPEMERRLSATRKQAEKDARRKKLEQAAKN